MKLYVANTTKQNHDFTYRLPEERNVRSETIRPGTQVIVGGDLPEDIVMKVIQQHEVFGLRDANKLSRLSDFVGLCYSIGKPVALDKMIFMFEQNDTHLNARAAQRMEDTALAIAKNAQAMVGHSGVHVQTTEVEVIEQTTGGATPSLNNGFEVVNEGVRSRRGGRQGRRANA